MILRITPRAIGSLPGWPIVALILLLLAPDDALGALTRWRVELPARAFERAWFVDPQAAESVAATGSLRGSGKDTGNVGWAEYPVTVPSAGWYLLGARGGVTDVTFEVKPDGAHAGVVFHATQEGRVGNVWLQAGRHIVRVSKLVWWGFDDLRAVTMQASDGSLVQSIRIERPDDHGIYRLGACPTVAVWASPSRSTQLSVFLRETESVDPGGIRRQVADRLADASSIAGMPIAAGDAPARYEVRLPCEREGVFRVSFGESGREFEPSHVAPFEYEVIDTRAAGDRTRRHEPSITGVGIEVLRFDAAQREPDYQSPAGTQVREGAAGPYRESMSDRGFQPWQRLPASTRAGVAEPTAWFAYRLDGLIPQRPYRLEVEYPDDSLRTFTISIRERVPLEYPVTGGIDTGGEFPLSDGTGSHALVFWPRSDSVRVVFANVHDGRRIGVARLRLVRLDEPWTVPSVPAAPSRSRDFASWYEEGLNFASVFGAPSDRGRVAMRVATERWARSIREIGGSVLMPTVSVYHFHLYPSRFVTATAKPTTDELRRIVLFAEKYQLDVVPELHVRGDDLARPDPRFRPLAERVLGSAGVAPVDPGLGRRLFSPAHPDNERWFRGLVRELAVRYGDSSALRGVSIRLMEHQNPGITNFGGREWGFDADTVRRFVRSTGVTLAIGTTPAEYSHEWRQWRERIVLGVIARLRDEVRAARTDLTLFLNVQGRQRQSDTVAGWLEAGVDLGRLAGLAGVQLLDGTARYGRDSIDPMEASIQRSRLANMRTVHALTPSRPGHHLASAQYVEATDSVIPPLAIGYPGVTRATWASGVVEPPGRHAVARFVRQLAQTDAVWLGDGGNGYLLGQPALWEFLAVYRRLPGQAFSTAFDLEGQVVVRELIRADGAWVYAVNASGKARRLRLEVDDSTEAPIRPMQGTLTIDLRPFDLVAFRVTSSGRPQGAALVRDVALDDGR
jgi:hypothetical protein